MHTYHLLVVLRRAADINEHLQVVVLIWWRWTVVPSHIGKDERLAQLHSDVEEIMVPPYFRACLQRTWHSI